MTATLVTMLELHDLENNDFGNGSTKGFLLLRIIVFTVLEYFKFQAHRHRAGCSFDYVSVLHTWTKTMGQQRVISQIECKSIRRLV